MDNFLKSVSFFRKTNKDLNNWKAFNITKLCEFEARSETQSRDSMVKSPEEKVLVLAFTGLDNLQSVQGKASFYFQD